MAGVHSQLLPTANYMKNYPGMLIRLGERRAKLKGMEKQTGA